MSTTVTWWSKSTRCCVGVGDVGPDQRASTWRIAPCEPADERVDRAGADGAAGPRSEVAVVVEHAVLDERRPARRTCAMTLPSMVTVPDRGSPPCTAARRSSAVTLCDDHRVLLAVVLGVGEQERQQLLSQNSAIVQKKLRDARACGWRRRARRAGVVAAGRREARRRWRTAPAGRPSVGVAVGLLGVERGVGVVEEEEVLALDVEDQRLGVVRPRRRARRSGTASTAGRWRRSSWWRRRRCR